MNQTDFCNSFEWHPKPEGGRVVTPWRYDDGDHVVVFVTREPLGWRLDDNGEGLFRLASAGVDTDSDRVQARLGAFPQLLGVQVDPADGTLFTMADDKGVGARALAVAEASAQIMGLACLRRDRSQPSDFRERVVAVVEEVARLANIESRKDVPVDESGTILADVYVTAARPIMVIAATSAQRLMEAEIIWLNAARRGEPVFVLATVEDAHRIGVGQYTRANYYTDKTVEFRGADALSDLISRQLQSQAH